MSDISNIDNLSLAQLQAIQQELHDNENATVSGIACKLGLTRSFVQSYVKQLKS